jgi:hypothetical protein
MYFSLYELIQKKSGSENKGFSTAETLWSDFNGVRSITSRVREKTVCYFKRNKQFFLL